MLRDETMLSAVINQLKVLGWTPWVEQGDNERAYSSTILIRAIRRLNPGITVADRQYAIQMLNPYINSDPKISDLDIQILIPQVAQVPHVHTLDSQQKLLATNQFVWNLLVQGVVVRQASGPSCPRIRYIDFVNPAWNTYVYQIASEQEPFDLILWVNGVPVVLIVLDVAGGVDSQSIIGYFSKNNTDPKVYYNHWVLRLGLTEAYIGTLSTPVDHYARWPAPPHTSAESPLASVMTALCDPASLLDSLQHFVVFESSGKPVKKVARYHQVRVVQHCIQRLLQGQTARDRGGVVWHTQGSGKSLSMLFLTRKIRQQLPGYKIVLLTDRAQLAQQLHTTFERNHNERVQVANSTAAFQTLLKTDAPNLILAMIQKCRAGVAPCMNASSRIIVLIDEAHRSQYGTLALTLQQWLPQAVRIAFTATPLLQSDRTRHVFGDIIDTYTLPQAVADGVTVPLIYVRREVQVTVVGDQLEHAFRTRFANCTEQTALQRHALNIPSLLNARPRIQHICRDIIQHYQQQIQPQGGKALVVTRSRQAAMHYHKILDQLSAPASACIISARSDDPMDYAGYTDRRRQTQAIQHFRDPQHPLSLLVVNDMLLTGFDAPICQAMYLDKQMQAHGLLQAVSRVNRKRAGKQQGYIIDYVGLAAKLSEALTDYGFPSQTPVKAQRIDRLSALRATHTRLKQAVGGVSHSAVAPRASLRDPQQNAQFYPLMSRFNRTIRQVMPAQAAQPYLADWRYWQGLSRQAQERYRPESAWLAAIQVILDAVLQVRLQTKGTIPVAYLVQGFGRASAPQPLYTAPPYACVIEQVVKHDIAVYINQDPDYFRHVIQQLDKLLHESADDGDKLEQLLLQLRDTIADNQRAQVAELTASEQTFYNIVLKTVQLTAVWDDNDQVQQAEIKQIARDIVAMLQQATQIVDFFYKQDEIKSIRKQIRRRLMDSTFGREDERMARSITDQCMAIARITFSKYKTTGDTG